MIYQLSNTNQFPWFTINISLCLAIGVEYFDGQSQEFSTMDGRQYVVGWDEAVTQEGAAGKCQSIGGSLAQIYTSERLENIMWVSVLNIISNNKEWHAIL